MRGSDFGQTFILYLRFSVVSVGFFNSIFRVAGDPYLRHRLLACICRKKFDYDESRTESNNSNSYSMVFERTKSNADKTQLLPLDTSNKQKSKGHCECI